MEERFFVLQKDEIEQYAAFYTLQEAKDVAKEECDNYDGEEKYFVVKIVAETKIKVEVTDV